MSTDVVMLLSVSEYAVVTPVDCVAAESRAQVLD